MLWNTACGRLLRNVRQFMRERAGIAFAAHDNVFPNGIAACTDVIRRARAARIIMNADAAEVEVERGAKLLLGGGVERAAWGGEGFMDRAWGEVPRWRGIALRSDGLRLESGKRSHACLLHQI